MASYWGLPKYPGDSWWPPGDGSMEGDQASLCAPGRVPRPWGAPPERRPGAEGPERATEEVLCGAR